VAPGKKNAARLGAHLVFIDESGFLLIPSVRKTWAPRGHTPLLRFWQRHDRLSVISGISVSPCRHRLGLYYRVHRANIRQPQVCEFLRHLLRHLRGPVIILWDNGRIHKGPLIRAFCLRFPRLHPEFFPAYAPELNPDEGIWTLAKATLANGRPDCVTTLMADLLLTFKRLRRSQSKLRGCITGSDLSFFALAIALFMQ
jgi:transposase